MGVTRTSPITTPKPSCTIAPSACSSLWSSYSQNYADDPWAPEPACEEPSTTCDPQTSFWTASDHPACLFNADPVRLVYFPVSVKGDRLCGTNYTTATSNETLPRTVEALGTTFTSGTAYISFQNLQASDRCGVPVGTRMENFFLPLPSSEVSSRCGEFGFQQFGPTSVPLNFADLNTPVALSVYSCMARCQFGVHDHWEPLCPTIYDDYAPALAYPTARIQKLQPEWANCGFDEMLLRSDILYDPPLALSEATTEASPTLPPQTAHVSTALPPATAAPTPVPSSIADNSEPDSNDPGDDGSDGNGGDQEDNDGNDSSPGETTAPATDPAVSSAPDSSAGDSEGDNSSSDDDDAENPGDSNSNVAYPATTAQNAASTRAAAIGDAIASVIGLIPNKPSPQAQSSNVGDPSDLSSTGDGSGTNVGSSGNGDSGDQQSGGQQSGGQQSGGDQQSGGQQSGGQQGDSSSGSDGTGAEEAGQGGFAATAGSLLSMATKSLIDAQNSPAGGSAATISGQVFSLAAGVVYQDSVPVTTLGPAAQQPTAALNGVPLSTNAAGSFVLDGTTLSNDGQPVTINGQTFSMSGDVLHQNSVAVTTAAPGGVPISTNGAGSLVLDGTTLSDNGNPLTLNGQTFSLSGDVLYSNGGAVATMSGSGKDFSLTIDGQIFSGSAISSGALVLDGKTISSGGQPVTVDGQLFSLLGSVLYQNGHAVTTMTQQRTTSPSRPARTTEMSSSSKHDVASSSAASSTTSSTGDANIASASGVLLLTTFTVIQAIMICL